MGRQDYAIYSPEGTRHCPECGTRVAQEADTCFFCGASLRSRPRRIAVPFAELLVTALIALIALGWWQTRGTRLLAYRAVFTATAQRATEATPTPTPTVPPTPTPTPTATVTPTPTPTPTPVIYVVQPNDTLLNIAAEFGITVEQLAAANGMSTSDFIQVGQELIIPPPEGLPTPTPTPTPDAMLINYRTQKGDTVHLVAEAFGVPVEAIIEANKLVPPYLLQPGTVLVIPLGTPQPTPTPTPFSTPTPTPGPRYPAPIPVLPPQGATFVGADTRVLLAWTAVAYLWPGEVYRLTLEAGSATWTFDTLRTSFVLPPALYEEVHRQGGHVRWWVQVVNTMTTPPEPRSHPSQERTFIWK